MTTFPTRAQFREWLAAKPHDEVVAHNWSCRTCPIAVFTNFSISPSLGIYYPIDKFYGDLGWHEKEKLPEWAEEFGSKVDSKFNSNVKPITAAECLRILDAIP